MRRTCSVKDCSAYSEQSHRFPLARVDRERFLKWLSAVGNKDNLALPPLKLRDRRVCGMHFEKKYSLVKRLSLNAVPTLYLPDPIDVSTYAMNMFGEPPLKKSKIATTERRFESIEGILNYENKGLFDMAFIAAVGNLPTDETFSHCDVNKEQERPKNNAQAPHIALAEESGDGSRLQTVFGKSIVEKELLTVRKHDGNESRVFFPVMNDEKTCTLCESFSKAGIRPHLMKLYRIMEQEPSEETKNFIGRGLQALIDVVLHQETPVHEKYFGWQKIGY